ncbi:MAG: NAD-dependent epimerase/dehydratase family protein, partial [Calditrichales bacterium]
MHVFVIGGSGFLSSKLVENFLARDVSVSMFHRGLNRPDFPDTDKLDIHLGDRDWPEDLRHAIGTREFDAVYDMVAYTPEQSRAVAEIFSERTARFIHCSTVSVYMVSDDVKCPIGENQDRLPLMKFWDRNPFGMDYGIKKRECEQVLWDAHDPTRFPVTMLRPTYISGPGDPAKRDYFWIERILDGQPLLVPGSGTFPFQNVFLDDVADAFVNIIKTDDSIGQAYNVAAEEIFTLDEYLKALGK